MIGKINTVHNSTYPKVAASWLNQALCFYQSLCKAESEVVLNRHLRVAAKRYAALIKMRRNIIIVLIIVAFSSIVRGQENETLLYNNKGQLRADTTLTITLGQLNKWRPVEEYIINMLVTQIEYSQMATESSLSGTSIVSFDVDSKGKLIDFKTLKQVGGGLEEVIKLNLKAFDKLTSLAPKDKKSFKYYLALSFQLIDVETFIKEENAIPIIKVKYDLIVPYEPKKKNN
jgi:hypothetical protein